MKLTEEQKADRRELVMLVQYVALAYALCGAGISGLQGALDVNSLWMGVAIALVTHVLIFSRPSFPEHFPETIYWISLVACAIGGSIVFILTTLYRRQEKKDMQQ